MLPSSIRAFLDAPRFASLAYLDDHGHPVLWRASGWLLGENGVDLSLIGNRALAGWLPPDGQAFRAAVVLMAADQFVSFQVKGVARARGATDAERRTGSEMLEQLGVIVERMSGTPAALYRSVAIDPAVTVDVVVDEAFVGSPGPGAGAPVGGEA